MVSSPKVGGGARTQCHWDQGCGGGPPSVQSISESCNKSIDHLMYFLVCLLSISLSSPKRSGNFILFIFIPHNLHHARKNSRLLFSVLCFYKIFWEHMSPGQQLIRKTISPLSEDALPSCTPICIYRDGSVCAMFPISVSGVAVTVEKFFLTPKI